MTAAVLPAAAEWESRLHRVSDLYGRHDGEDIYVVGTGASLRVFPLDFLADRITIGLNLAWRTVDVTYGITIHPELNIPEFLPGERPRPGITWVVKHDKIGALAPEQIREAEERFYFFRTDGRVSTRPAGESDAGRFPSWVRQPTGNFLYLWTSIAQPALNLAANMGARNVILVGCDNMALGGNHHATAQHTRWLGATPDDRYRQYYEALAEVRSALRDRGVNVLSLTPFLGLDRPHEDFDRLCHELGVARDVGPVADISPRRPPAWLRARRKLARTVRRTANGGWQRGRERRP